MRSGSLLREAALGALGARVASTLILLVVAAVCTVVVVTAGQADATRRQVRAQLGEETARMVRLDLTRRAPLISARTAEAAAAISGVSSAIATSAPVDVVNAGLGPGAPVVPARTATGELSGVLQIVEGRAAGPGEALVSEQACTILGLEGPFGAVQDGNGHQVPVVGVYRARPAFAELSSGVLIVAAPPTAAGGEGQADEMYTSLRMPARDVGSVAGVQGAAVSLLAPQDPTLISVDSPVARARTAVQLDARLAAAARTLLLTVLGIGVFFVAAVVLADVLVRSRDLGRRRTLGITRTDLVSLVVLRTSLPAAIGAGAALGVCALVPGLHGIPASTLAGIGVLSVISAVIAAVPPALYAAHRDPVRVMRTA